MKKVWLLTILCGTFWACGQNQNAQQERKRQEALKKELAEMRDEMKEWTDEIHEELRRERKSLDSLSKDERIARRDSLFRYIEKQLQRSADALERWSEKNGPEVEAWADEYAKEIEAWADEYADEIEETSLRLTKGVAEWAEKLAHDLEKAAERAEKREETTEPK